MTRKEIYSEIKKRNLKEEITKVFGDSYTRVSSDKLEEYLKKHKKKGCKKPNVDWESMNKMDEHFENEVLKHLKAKINQKDDDNCHCKKISSEEFVRLVAAKLEDLITILHSKYLLIEPEIDTLNKWYVKEKKN